MAPCVFHTAIFLLFLASAFPWVVSGQNFTLVDNTTNCDPFATRDTYNSTYDSCECDAGFTGNGTTCVILAELDCSSSPSTSGYAFRVLLNKTYIDTYYDYRNLRLLNNSCDNVTEENGKYVLFSLSYDDCGTTQSNNSDTVIYSNAVRSDGGTVSTGDVLNIDFSCYLSATLSISLSDSNDTAAPINVVQVVGDSQIILPIQQGTGSVSASMYLYKDANYATVYNGVPVLTTTDMIYVKIALDHILKGVFIVSRECWATPDAAGTSSENLRIIESPGCLRSAVPNGLLTSNGISEESRFQLQVFQFLPSNVVYLHCNIELCTPATSGSCQPTCSGARRKRSTNSNIRTITSTLIIHGSKHIPEPPTVSAEDTKSNISSNNPDNSTEKGYTPNTVVPVLIGLVAVLVVVIIVIFVYIYKKDRNSKSAKFPVKPSRRSLPPVTSVNTIPSPNNC